MTQPPRATDGADFLAAAVRERMLTEACARDLRKAIKRSGQPPGAYLVGTGRLTAIQAEAIEGLLDGDSVAEGYQVVGLLGHGGIGIVYRARQPNLDREVALKTISAARVHEANGGKGSSTLERFQQEARAVAKLKHPNIVTAYDYGAGADRLYLAMEMVDGIDLESLIHQQDRIDEPTAWRLVRQTAAALAHALELGVIHRDIKPANLLLTEPPAGYPLPAGVPLLKVTDFGLARLNQRVPGKDEKEATRLTVVGATMGTPHYMAPEQIDDAKVDHLADIYALGATAWHMIAGEPPLAGLSMIKIFTAKLAGEGASLDDLPPDVSEPTRELLAAMLRHDPSGRPQDYAELLARIDEVLGEDRVAAVNSRLAAADAALASTLGTLRKDTRSSSEVSETLLMPTPPSGRRRAWPLAAAVVFALAAWAVWWLGGAASAEKPPPRNYTQGARSEPLFNGAEVISWKAMPGTERGVGGGDYARWLGFSAGNASPRGGVTRSIGPALEALGDSEGFAITFNVRLADGEWMEVWCGPPAEGPPVLRIERQVVRFGYRKTEFTDLGEPMPIDATQAINVSLERFGRHWFALVNGVLVGWADAPESAPGVVRFDTGKRKVYLGDVTIVSLQASGAG